MPSRWCSTETTLPRSCATSLSSLRSSPGRSCTRLRPTREWVAAVGVGPGPHDGDWAGGVDVAARQERDGGTPAARLAGEQRRDTHRARALDDERRARAREPALLDLK